MPRTIYFDYNATTPLDPQVRDSMLPFLGEVWGNPSSVHHVGQQARAALDAGETIRVVFEDGGYAGRVTVAIQAERSDDLEALVEEFLEKDDGGLVLALVALSRSLCLATSKLVHVLDEDLSDEAAEHLSEGELRPTAVALLRKYALAAAMQSDAPKDDYPAGTA